MNIWKYWLELCSRHPFMLMGIIIGLLAGALILIIGFWRALFLFICIAIGCAVGWLYEHGLTIRQFYKKYIKKQEM